MLRGGVPLHCIAELLEHSIALVQHLSLSMEVQFNNHRAPLLGYASFELETSEKPVLGDWKITAFVKTYQKSLNIELKKFVLPKFQVTMKPPAFISKFTNDLETEICAK